MSKYTANYTYTNPNFVIQNLEYKRSESDMLPLLYVLKNLLQRGYPTTMSKYLQEKVGKIQELADFEKRLLFLPDKPNKWFGTIKGSEEMQYNPAREFYEHILVEEMGEYSFVQPMIIPEIGINEIIGTFNKNFVDQQVDFYLPQARLVIEIDGGQHKRDIDLDERRNQYFKENGIETVRISTRELKNHTYEEKLDSIKKRIDQYKTKGAFAFYKSSFERSRLKNYTADEVHNKMLPTAIIRFQLLFLDLLINEYLKFGRRWRFNIKCDDPIGDFAKLAIDDVYVWLNNLVMLRDKHELEKFQYEIKIAQGDEWDVDSKAVNVDFSLFKRYTDEDTMNPSTIFVRSDYFDCSQKRDLVGLDKNYFEVSTTQSINYNITDNDKPTLRFFLQNIFNKRDFRDGQFAIISNALNLHDTIGLLPTGGGKSLCFQLPCLLQPSINFVVCPIKSLMRDQVDNLKRKDVSIKNVNFISSDQSAEERDYIMKEYQKGRYFFIWISPERFQIPSFRSTMVSVISDFNISYAVIDEVHCLSEWGHDFRTSYLNLAKTIDRLSPKDESGEGCIKFIGLTATASVFVLKDIKIEFARNKQQLDDYNIKTKLDFARPELEFEVIDDKGKKFAALDSIFKQEGIPYDTSKATLVFTPFRNSKIGCKQLADNLSIQYGDQVSWYSGECPTFRDKEGNEYPIMSQRKFDNYKIEVQNNFKENKFQVLCTTKAFGMGIDKQNIFYTIHYGLPGSVESLYQEAGRAGRWDKSLEENRGKIGKCYVLHTHETPQTQQDLDLIYSPSTSVSAIIKSVDKNFNNGGDVFKQLRLLVNGLKDVKEDFELITEIINTFYKEGETRDIYYSEFTRIKNRHLAPDEFEKYIYRLCLLGVAEDWTNDYKSKFTVKFNTTDDYHVLKSLESYIQKYNPDEMVEANVRNLNEKECDTILKKATWYLLEWILKNITENRKQSLKTLSDWCLNFQDNASFKRRIDSYFTFNESTFVLQHIADNPYDITQWFEVFYNNKKFITGPEIIDLRDRLSRFLESCHNNPGLDFVSGMVRFFLDDFEDADGKNRLVNSLKRVSEIYKDTPKDNVFTNGIVQFLKDASLSDEKLTEICSLIMTFFSEQKAVFAEELEMPWLYADIIDENIQKLKKLNKQLYEQIGRI